MEIFGKPNATEKVNNDDVFSPVSGNEVIKGGVTTELGSRTTYTRRRREGQKVNRGNSRIISLRKREKYGKVNTKALKKEEDVCNGRL